MNPEDLAVGVDVVVFGVFNDDDTVTAETVEVWEHDFDDYIEFEGAISEIAGRLECDTSGVVLARGIERRH